MPLQKFNSSTQFIRHYIGPRLSRNDRIRFWLTLLMVGIVGISNAVVPYLFKNIIDILSVNNSQGDPHSGSFNVSEILRVMGGIVIIYILLIPFNRILLELKILIFNSFEVRAMNAVRNDYLSHILSLPLTFHLNRALGKLDEKFGAAMRGFQSVISILSNLIVPIIFELVVALVLLLAVIGPKYVLFLCLITLLFLTNAIIGNKLIKNKQRKTLEVLVEIRGLASDLTLNYETIKLFNGKNYVLEGYRKQLEKFVDFQDSYNLYRFLIGLTQGILVASTIIVIMIITIYDVIAGQITIGSLVMVNLYAVQLSRPMEGLGNAYRDINAGLTAIEKMNELMNLPCEEVTALNNAKFQSTFNSKIHQPISLKLENVSYSYEDRNPVLSSLSFSIKAGEQIALVGKTGGGKSTILRLIMGLLKLKHGTIRVDGIDIREIGLEKLRAIIAVVPQDVFLLNASMRENIRFGRQDASDHEIEKIVRISGLADVVDSWPNGLETTVGELGNKLSGGERQRVGIARALLKRPRFIIFDEATSSLDLHTEQSIFRDFFKVSDGITKLIITHRLSNAVFCDRILFIENGIVRETGSHSDLLLRKGGYYKLWNSQSKD